MCTLTNDYTMQVRHSCTAQHQGSNALGGSQPHSRTPQLSLRPELIWLKIWLLKMGLAEEGTFREKPYACASACDTGHAKSVILARQCHVGAW